MKGKGNTLVSWAVATMMAATVAGPVAAQGKRQQDKNNMRNLGTGLGAAAAVEALRGKGTNALILGAGAAYAGKKYEDSRKAQSKENARRYSRSAPRRQARKINVVLDGEEMIFRDTDAQILRGRTYVPLRGVLEEMGAVVEWDSATRSVLANHEDTRVRLPINSYTATLNGRSMHLDAPARVLNGRTMVPLRFMAEAFGAQVAWNSRTREVRIDGVKTAAESE